MGNLYDTSPWSPKRLQVDNDLHVYVRYGESARVALAEANRLAGDVNRLGMRLQWVWDDVEMRLQKLESALGVRTVSWQAQDDKQGHSLPHC